MTDKLSSCLKSCERFDWEKGTWEMLPPLNEARRAHCAVALPDGVYVLGGFNGINAPPLNVPGYANWFLFPEDIFYVAMAALIIGYFLCVWLIRSHFGRVAIAIRGHSVKLCAISRI